MKIPALAILMGLGLIVAFIGCEPTTPPPPTSITVTVDDPVHVTRTGKCYHQAGCRYLDASDFIESRSQAVSQGLTPCTLCETEVQPPEMVHITATGKAFHKAGCQYLDKSDTTEPREEAVRQGLKACTVCGG